MVPFAPWILHTLNRMISTNLSMLPLASAFDIRERLHFSRSWYHGSKPVLFS